MDVHVFVSYLVARHVMMIAFRTHRQFSWFGVFVHLVGASIYTVCVSLNVVAGHLRRVRSVVILNVQSSNATGFYAVVFKYQCLILGVRNFGCYEPCVNFCLMLVVFRRDVFCVRIVQVWRRCDQHTRGRSHSIGVNKFVHGQFLRRV